jgi:DNA-binding CsgD family transcriptional regulator
MELTPKETEVVRWVMTGLMDKEIALRMAVSRQTLKNHVTHIYQKGNFENRIQLANWVYRKRPDLLPRAPEETKMINDESKVLESLEQGKPLPCGGCGRKNCLYCLFNGFYVGAAELGFRPKKLEPEETKDQKEPG